MQAFRLEPDEPSTPPRLAPNELPEDEHLPEVSMVEAQEVTGVTFSPELWMQRRHWALEVLRRESVRSVLDIGCGPGALLETLVQRPSTIFEPPLRRKRTEQRSEEGSDGDEQEYGSETFITRLAGLDSNPAVLPSALSILSPHSRFGSAADEPDRQRWEPLHTELYLGDIEKYNSRLEGYEAIVALEVIEHLEEHVLSRFGVVTMGTYRPRLLLVSTPNFDFNAKFPRSSHDHEHDFAHRGYIDPTGRTERVFRHSDHKLEMTSAEFRSWATAAAADWGYTVDISGVGISSSPSYYPSDHVTPNAPIYASNVAIFRLGSGIPTRSPRSVRSSELPWLSKENNHPHKLVGRFTHPGWVAPVRELKGEDRILQLLSMVKATMQQWNVGNISLDELWGNQDIARYCDGSKRFLVAALGGWGDQEPALPSQDTRFSVYENGDRGLYVRSDDFEPRVEKESQDWGQTVSTEAPSAATGGW